MRLLTGLIHPDAGTIELLGRPFGRGDRRRLFEVGALIESPSFYPYLSGRENLRALAATGAPSPNSRVEELLELVGLRDRAQRQGPGLLARHEAAARHRRRAAQRPAAAAARRAVERARSGRDRGDARDAPAPRRRPARRSSSRATSSARSSSSPTSSGSSRPGGSSARARSSSSSRARASSGSGSRRPRSTRRRRCSRRWRRRRRRRRRSPAEDGLAVGPDRAGARGRGQPRARRRPGIYASGLETGSDLESLFLELTGGEQAASREGTFFGVAGSGVPPAGRTPARPGPARRGRRTHEAVRRRHPQAHPAAGDVRHVRAAGRAAGADLHRRRRDGRPRERDGRSAPGRAARS